MCPEDKADCAGGERLIEGPLMELRVIGDEARDSPTAEHRLPAADREGRHGWWRGVLQPPVAAGPPSRRRAIIAGPWPKPH